ncbi:unnamed protein product, partial [Musa textilis]
SQPYLKPHGHEFPRLQLGSAPSTSGVSVTTRCTHRSGHAMSSRTLNRSSSVSSRRCLLNARSAESCRWELGTASLRVSSLPLRLLLPFFGAANHNDKVFVLITVPIT